MHELEQEKCKVWSCMVEGVTQNAGLQNLLVSSGGYTVVSPMFIFLKGCFSRQKNRRINHKFTEVRRRGSNAARQ